jgi:hypothetical protein
MVESRFPDSQFDGDISSQPIVLFQRPQLDESVVRVAVRWDALTSADEVVMPDINGVISLRWMPLPETWSTGRGERNGQARVRQGLADAACSVGCRRVVSQDVPCRAERAGQDSNSHPKDAVAIGSCR